MGGPDNFDILQVSGPKTFAFLWVGGFIRPPRMIVHGGNSVGEWSEKLCNSGGGWSEKIAILGVGGPKKRLRTPPPLTFNGIALSSF